MTMGYDLTCKICQPLVESGEITPDEAKIKIGDIVESKAGGLHPQKGEEDSRGRKRTPKFYHYECYESYHLDFTKEGKPLNGYGEAIEQEVIDGEKNEG
jgi:polyhydroxyalkanoate synthesis regulator phasin